MERARLSRRQERWQPLKLAAARTTDLALPINNYLRARSRRIRSLSGIRIDRESAGQRTTRSILRNCYRRNRISYTQGEIVIAVEARPQKRRRSRIYIWKRARITSLPARSGVARHEVLRRPVPFRAAVSAISPAWSKSPLQDEIISTGPGPSDHAISRRLTKRGACGFPVADWLECSRPGFDRGFGAPSRGGKLGR